MIPLVRPTTESDDESSYEKIVNGFEKKVASYIGVKGGVATNSGTTALHLALKALKVGPSDEVILPSYTCTALLHAINYVGAIPVFVDISFDVEHMNYNLETKDVFKKISKKTKTIVAPHLFGSPAEIDKIKETNISIVEDATQNIGSTYKNQRIGSFGDITIFSFHSSKMISCGEGGMVTSNNQRLLDYTRRLADYTSDQQNVRLTKQKKFCYEERYNYRINTTSALLGVSQLKQLDGFVEKRKQIAKIYDENFRNIKKIRLPDPFYKPNIFFRYMVCLEKKHPVEILEYLKKKGIEGGRGVYPPLHYYNQTQKKTYPSTEYAVNHLLSIPIYPSLTETEIDYVIEQFKRGIK